MHVHQGHLPPPGLPQAVRRREEGRRNYDVCCELCAVRCACALWCVVYSVRCVLCFYTIRVLTHVLLSFFLRYPRGVQATSHGSSCEHRVVHCSFEGCVKIMNSTRYGHSLHVLCVVCCVCCAVCGVLCAVCSVRCCILTLTPVWLSFSLRCVKRCKARDMVTHTQQCTWRTTYCHHQVHGCDAMFPVKDLDAHSRTCPFRQVPCRNRGCGYSGAYKDMKDHASKCPKARVQVRAAALYCIQCSDSSVLSR